MVLKTVNHRESLLWAAGKTAQDTLDGTVIGVEYMEYTIY
jgi:hypothetical protein